MNNEELELLNGFIKKVSNYGACTYNIRLDSDSIPYPTLENYSDDLTVSQWYANQRAISECLNLDFFHPLSQNIGRYYQDDKQFPPDLLKCCRLYGILKIYNPDCIIELGCGTSTLVVTQYLNSLSHNKGPRYMCIEKEAEWLEITQRKITSIFPKKMDNASYLQHESDLETISSFKRFTSKQLKIFIYLDARILKGDSADGMELILKALTELEHQQELILLIDARNRAVCTLTKLAKTLGRNLTVISNCLYPVKKEHVGGAFHRYQHMGSFTIARTK